MTRPQLTKTCSSCGLKKPLSAFLQMDDVHQGTVYSNICANCRKTMPEHPILETDGINTSTTGIRIDSKTKLQEATDKQQKFTLTEEEYHEERLKAEEQQTEVKSKKQDIANKERDHRENFLKQSTFLNQPRTPSATEEPVFGGETQTASEREINLTIPFQDTGISGKVKYSSSPIFKAFTDRLGRTPIARHAEKASHKIDPKNTLQNASDEEVAKRTFLPGKKS